MARLIRILEYEGSEEVLKNAIVNRGVRGTYVIHTKSGELTIREGFVFSSEIERYLRGMSGESDDRT